MENLYRDALRQIRTPLNPSKLDLNIAWSYRDFGSLEELSTEPKEEKTVSQVTEKTKVLDQLYQFGEKAVADKPSLKIEGGEIVRKEESVKAQMTQGELEFSLKDLSAIEAFYRENQIPEVDINFKLNKLKELSGIKVFFITDSNFLREVSSEDTQGTDLNMYFDKSVTNLFARMIAAMKLGQNDYAICSASINDCEINDILLSELMIATPALVMTLGAKATETMLKSSQRLKDIHGRFYEGQLKADSGETKLVKIMPIFSPKLLQTAPNMKKTAWDDMQEAMKFLNL